MGWFRRCHTSKKEKEERDIDYSSLLQSMDKGQSLFNQLKVKCHPDRYVVGTDKQSVAEELFKLIQANSTNYEKLVELKERVEKEL